MVSLETINRASVFNALPHVDTLFSKGVRSVDLSHPSLPAGTMWSLKHKHFDLQPKEILLFKVLPDSMTVQVVEDSESANLHPCQAVYDQGKWLVVGMTDTPCDLRYPAVEGSGMISALLKSGVWNETTDERARTQRFTRWSPSDSNGEEYITTASDGVNYATCTRSHTSIKCGNKYHSGGSGGSGGGGGGGGGKGGGGKGGGGK